MPKKSLLEWIKKLFPKDACKGDCGCHRVVDKLMEQNIPGHRGTDPYPQKRDPSDDYSQGGFIMNRCSCGGSITSTSGGVITEYCTKCGKDYQKPTYS